MKIFLDSADFEEISAAAATGLLDGVTTNPSLVAKSATDFYSNLERICDLVPGPISAESVAEDSDGMVREGERLASVADNVVVKLPISVAGLRACQQLSEQGIATNLTLCFSPAQALLAAKSGASFVSPFIGRLDDCSADGMALIEDIQTIFANYDFDCQILAASIRHPMHVLECARIGADVVTLPAKIFWQLFEHPLTSKGIASFAADWQKSGQKIL